jgi:hypothetical protein
MADCEKDDRDRGSLLASHRVDDVLAQRCEKGRVESPGPNVVGDVQPDIRGFAPAVTKEKLLGSAMGLVLAARHDVKERICPRRGDKNV